MLAGAARAAGGWDNLSSFFWRKLPILVYHHVGPFVPETFRFLTVSPKAFERQMDWLRRNRFTTITPQQWVRWLENGESLPERPVLITFDDGYRDIAVHALPALHERHMTATVYVVTGRCGGINAWDLVYTPGEHRLLDSRVIKFWHERGIEIGSHTSSHRRLENLNRTDLNTEITCSANELGVILGSQADSFSYPYGAFDREAAELVAGSFSSAVTTQIGLNDLWTPRNLLRRANVDPTHEWFDFPFLVRLGWGPYEQTHAYLARQRRALARRLRTEKDK
jgi:peptidoglycan/xylan/chitin deacetylase (PgdA/CDA1 family)